MVKAGVFDPFGRAKPRPLGRGVEGLTFQPSIVILRLNQGKLESEDG